MKKLLTALLCALALCASVLGFTACKSGKGEISVYAPDGAPALALAQLMNEEKDFGKNVKYHVVSSDEIASTVTYTDDSKNADMCILPVNAASKLLGNGARYKMLGTVTHGNLYIVANAEKPQLTAANFVENLSGAKVGVVNFAAFPGAATKLIMQKYGILNSVTLEGVAATQVDGASKAYDYFVIPEPAASTRTANANLNLKQVGSLQTLYGEGGYPQAVLVAKNSLIEKEPELISEFMNAMKGSADWLLKDDVAAETIINAVKKHYADPENTKPAFTAANLTKPVIRNCAINFVSASNCKTQVKTFLNELIGVNDSTATAVSDDFFYTV